MAVKSDSLIMVVSNQLYRYVPIYHMAPNYEILCYSNGYTEIVRINKNETYYSIKLVGILVSRCHGDKCKVNEIWGTENQLMAEAVFVGDSDMWTILWKPISDLHVGKHLVLCNFNENGFTGLEHGRIDVLGEAYGTYDACHIQVDKPWAYVVNDFLVV